MPSINNSSTHSLNVSKTRGGYKRIAHKLNAWNVKTSRGNTWLNTSVSSVLRRKY